MATMMCQNMKLSLALSLNIYIIKLFVVIDFCLLSYIINNRLLTPEGFNWNISLGVNVHKQCSKLYSSNPRQLTYF